MHTYPALVCLTQAKMPKLIPLLTIVAFVGLVGLVQNTSEPSSSVIASNFGPLRTVLRLAGVTSFFRVGGFKYFAI